MSEPIQFEYLYYNQIKRWQINKPNATALQTLLNNINTNKQHTPIHYEKEDDQPMAH